MEGTGAVADARVICEESSLRIKQNPYSLKLTTKRIQWQRINSKNDGKTTIVRCADIIACRTEENRGQHLLTLSYIVEGKNLVMKRKVVSFNGEPGACDRVRDHIKDAVRSASWRPQSILVFINPISGRSKGQQVYASKVAPLFAEAEIKTEVIVTERAHHTEEVLKTYNLDTIDGIVLVGGDGLYHEFNNGLVQRMAMDSAQDSTNPEYEPPEFNVPVGIIPCGTGNGIVRAAVGNYDVVSAALTIVLGYRTKNNLHSVFCGDRLVTYSSLLEGYGLWGDTILDAESRRHLGIWRYPLAIGRTFLINEHRRMSVTLSIHSTAEVKDWNELNMSYVTGESRGGGESETGHSSGAQGGVATPPEKSANKNESPADAGVASGEDSNADNQIRDQQQNTDGEMLSRTITVTALMGFSTADFSPCAATEPPFADINTYSAILVTKPIGRLAIMQFMGKFISSMDTMLSQADSNFPILLTRGFTVKLNNPSPQDSDPGQKEHIVNIDGEVFPLHKPAFSVRVFPSRIPFFCNIPRITERHKENITP